MHRPGVVWREAEPLARHTPRRIGGACDLWVVVHDPAALDDVVAAVRARGGTRTVLGAGTRVLVRDGGLAGTVLRLGDGFAGIEDDGDGAWVGGACPLARVGVWAGAGALRGLVRQPGTLGASVRLDPGWGPWIDAVRIHHRGGLREVDLEAARAAGTAIVVGARVRRTAARSGARAPGATRPWSVFEEVPRRDVAEVLRQASLGGTRLREVCLPAADPTALANLGGGTARDVDLLLRSVVDRVQRERGIELSTRPAWLGRAS